MNRGHGTRDQLTAHFYLLFRCEHLDGHSEKLHEEADIHEDLRQEIRDAEDLLKNEEHEEAHCEANVHRVQTAMTVHWEFGVHARSERKCWKSMCERANIPTGNPQIVVGVVGVRNICPR